MSGRNQLVMSRKLTLIVDGVAFALKSLIKLVKLIVKCLLPAKETYDLTVALTLFDHGLPLLIEENLFCDKSIISICGNKNN